MLFKYWIFPPETELHNYPGIYQLWLFFSPDPRQEVLETMMSR